MNAVVDFPVKPEARPYLDATREHLREPEWLVQHRRRALARFAELGFPSRRGEAWRYLDLRPLQQEPLLPAGAVAGAPRILPDEVGFPGTHHRLVLLDGCFLPELSRISGLPPGVWFGSTQQAIEARPNLVGAALAALSDDRDQAFAALNAGVFTEGFVLDVAPGVVLEEPIEIVHFASGQNSASFHTRSLVTLGAKSRLRLIETFAGEGRYWRNDVLALQTRRRRRAGSRSAGRRGGRGIAYRSNGCRARLPRARLTSFALLLGGGTLRQEVVVRSEGEGAHCGLYGGFVASRRQQANIVTTVDHLAERGETREIFKGVAAGRAHGAFQGRITVRPGAQKVDAHMLSRNLLLGAHAAIDTKPELEIFADDVKCSHGAAVGDLDETALFYLLARGIPREQARHMLIEAFMREAVEIVEPGALREHLLARLGQRLAMLEE